MNFLKIIEENGYYPYGLKHSVYNSNLEAHKAVANQTVVELKGIPSGGGSATVANVTNQYKFNGQEWQSELALNLYDMDMRDYDPAIGRWLAIDPVTHFSQSPYYAFDANPVFWADPSGADAVGLPPEAINTWHMAGSNYATSGGTGKLASGDHMFGESGDEFWGNEISFTGGQISWTKYLIDLEKEIKKTVTVSNLSEGEILDQEKSKEEEKNSDIVELRNYFPDPIRFKVDDDTKINGFKYKAYNKSYILASGASIKINIDGVKVNGIVTKVTNGTKIITISKNGNVHTIYANIAKQIYYFAMGGTISTPPDPGWDALFND